MRWPLGPVAITLVAASIAVACFAVMGYALAGDLTHPGATRACEQDFAASLGRERLFTDHPPGLTAEDVNPGRCTDEDDGGVSTADQQFSPSSRPRAELVAHLRRVAVADGWTIRTEYEDADLIGGWGPGFCAEKAAAGHDVVAQVDFLAGHVRSTDSDFALQMVLVGDPKPDRRCG